MTTIDPKKHSVGSYDAYEYTVHSHQYTTEDIPAARFSYELSPIQVASGQRHIACVCMCSLSALPCTWRRRLSLTIAHPGIYRSG